MSPVEALNLDNLGQFAYNLYSSDKQVDGAHFKLSDRVHVSSQLLTDVYLVKIIKVDGQEKYLQYTIFLKQFPL